MKVVNTKLPGVLILEPKVFGDSRGCFFESFRANQYAEQGLSLPFVQDNISKSTHGVLRGLHHQKQLTQGKLVTVICGQVFDVAVDIRRDSKTFGQWVGVTLDDQNHHQLYIPPGFAHGFCVLSDEAHFIYKCTNYYDSASELTVRWDDPDLAIDWPIKNPILSAKDNQGKFLKDIPTDQLPTVQK